MNPNDIFEEMLRSVPMHDYLTICKNRLTSLENTETEPSLKLLTIGMTMINLGAYKNGVKCLTPLGDIRIIPFDWLTHHSIDLYIKITGDDPYLPF